MHEALIVHSGMHPASTRRGGQPLTHAWGRCEATAQLPLLTERHATGFAAVLVAILKSDAIKTLLTNIIKQALKVG